jgi:chromosome segregation ATPase
MAVCPFFNSLEILRTVMVTLTLSIVEIVVLMLGAIILGITIHFFITSHRNLKTSLEDPRKKEQNLNEWKLKYFNDVEVKERELLSLRKQLQETEENNKIDSIEAEEMRKENRKLNQENELLKKTASQQPAPAEKTSYFEQLKLTQSGLMEHNEKINQLLSHIDMLKETEQKQKQLLQDNEELYNQIEDLQAMLAEKDKEINSIRQKASLSREVTSMLDNAYAEFNGLQEKIQKLESQVNASRNMNLDHEELKEEHYKMAKDFEEQRLRLGATSTENHELQLELRETEDKLREANFQRQQLQKRVAFLEELNNDLQMVSDSNKRLEGQIRRIGELESMLNMVSEERDQLIRKQH